MAALTPLQMVKMLDEQSVEITQLRRQVTWFQRQIFDLSTTLVAPVEARAALKNVTRAARPQPSRRRPPPATSSLLHYDPCTP